MTRFIIGATWRAVFVAVVCGTVVAAAGVARGEACVAATPVRVSEPAKCTGVAFGAVLARTLSKCRAADLPKCESALLIERGYRDADRTRFESRLLTEVNRGDELKQRLLVTAGILPVPVPWYRRTWFVVVTSVVITAVVVGGTVALCYETGAL